MDQIIPFIPEYESINIESIVRNSNIPLKDKWLTGFVVGYIEDLLYERFKYADRKTPGKFQGYLNEKGKEAKEAGGHYKYEAKIKDQKKIEKERQLRADQKTDQDLRNSQFEGKMGR